MADDTIKETDRLEKEKKIAPTKNLKGKPVFVYTNEIDNIIPTWHQRVEVMQLEHYKADVKWVRGRKERHWLSPSVQIMGMNFLMEHFGQTNPNPVDIDFIKHGYLVKFD